MQDCKTCLQKLCAKLLERSPLKYKLTKAISFSDPAVAVLKLTRSERLTSTLEIDPAVAVLKSTRSERLTSTLEIVLANNWLTGVAAELNSRGIGNNNMVAIADSRRDGHRTSQITKHVRSGDHAVHDEGSAPPEEGKEALEVKTRIQKMTLTPGILSAIAANTATVALGARDSQTGKDRLCTDCLTHLKKYGELPQVQSIGTANSARGNAPYLFRPVQTESSDPSTACFLQQLRNQTRATLFHKAQLIISSLASEDPQYD
uniref:(California timema) hypothetical protein n=1 Tax=Timema californicum TaxID=61474 RepID=A0A7R9J6P1_TIMCA|nr:unnamed protein product [Timema californicum]